MVSAFYPFQNGFRSATDPLRTRGHIFKFIARMGEDILEWAFGRLYGPLYDRVEQRHGKVAALIMSMTLAFAIIVVIPVLLFVTL